MQMTTVFLNQIWPKADHSPVGFFLRASFSFYKRSLAQGSQVLGEDRVENDVEFGPSVTLDRERIMNSCHQYQQEPASSRSMARLVTQDVWKAEAEGSQVQGLPGLHCEFKATMGKKVNVSKF